MDFIKDKFIKESNIFNLAKTFINKIKQDFPGIKGLIDYKHLQHSFTGKHEEILFTIFTYNRRNYTATMTINTKYKQPKLTYAYLCY